jgi:ATP-binding cassette subfamily A (ABC1) protein 3
MVCFPLYSFPVFFHANLSAEPSTGMDPLSKRLMWRVITELGHDKAIMVTTHYMEECEALCSRIGIMSQGRLVCLGSSQHLKSRFATGYPF